MYDVLGNLTNKGGVTQNFPTTASVRPHALTGVAGQSWLFEYDANGNTKKASGRQIEWDVQNMPTSVTGTDGVTESYTYDANGQRVSRTRPVTGGGSVTTLYFGLHEEEISSSQSTTRTLYSFGGCTVQRTAVTVGSMTTTTLAYLHGDHLGSVSLTTDASGAVTSQQNYDAWGKGRGTVGGTSPTTMNYTGQKRDDTGLLFYNARYYDPGIGRFLSADTIAIGKDSQSRNRYTYVGNNPINRIDPSGHAPKSPTDDSAPPCDTKCQLQDSKYGLSAETLKDLFEKDAAWQLDDILKWLKFGIRFTGAGWSSIDIDVVRQALDRVYNFFYNEFTKDGDATITLMRKAFGIKVDAFGNVTTFLTIHKHTTKDGGTVDGLACPVVSRDCKTGNTIELGLPPGSYQPYTEGKGKSSDSFAYAIQTMIHELGHMIDAFAGRNALNEWYTFRSGSPWPIDPKGAVSAYALLSQREDFAETFAYMVQTVPYNQSSFLLHGELPNPTKGATGLDDTRRNEVCRAISGASCE